MQKVIAKVGGCYTDRSKNQDSEEIQVLRMGQ